MMWIKYVLIGLFLTSCASSRHWQEDKLIENPLTGEKRVVTVDVIEQIGIIKAKHPTGAEGESKPWVEMPTFYKD